MLDTLYERDRLMPRVQLLLTLLITAFLTSASRGAEPPKVGDAIGKLKFTDIRSLPRTLDDFGEKKAYVLVFVNSTCPVAQRYLPILQELENEYRDRGVQFVAVNAAEHDSVIAMATQAVKYEIAFPFVKDFGGVSARQLGVTRTPEVAVLDSEKVLRYRGRIDDQHRLGGVRKDAKSRELKDALDAILAGRKVAKPETEVDGCPITFAKPKKPREVTYSEHVAGILKKHCWQCHREGGSAPFALTSYKQASSRAASLAEVIRDQRMPPWFASHEFGPFMNQRGLSDEERATIADWAETGAAVGDLSKAPASPKDPVGKWQIGDPDLVLKTGEFELPAKGDIPYQYAVLLHLFTEDTWIQGAQITSDNPAALHHCNMAFAGLTEKFREGNFITGSVPGGEPLALEDGLAFCIPKGSVLGLQMHFVATGKPEKCRISVGLRFPRATVEKRLRHIQLADHRFAIPPGVSAHKVTASKTLDEDVVGVGLFSHMHLRGKDMTFRAHMPAGKTETLLIIPNYNFAWQIPYHWETGKKQLPKGTRLECIAHFDNSSFNPFNPNPLATVRDGPQTHNEMMYGFFFYTNANEKLGMKIDPKTGLRMPRER